MKDIYTTKTGVKIGLAYEPPRKMQMSADMERLQTALLNAKRSILPHMTAERAVDILCWILAVIMLIGMFVIGSNVFA